MNRGFADPCLATWLRRRDIELGLAGASAWFIKMERKTRLELATSSLARRRSTTELLPLDNAILTQMVPRGRFELPRAHHSLAPQASVSTIPPSRRWQEWKDSNPRPVVLETTALPTELHSYKVGAGKNNTLCRRALSTAEDSMFWKSICQVSGLTAVLDDGNPGAHHGAGNDGEQRPAEIPRHAHVPTHLL